MPKLLLSLLTFLLGFHCRLGGERMPLVTGLVPSRFLTLTAHLVIVITIFWSRVRELFPSMHATILTVVWQSLPGCLLRAFTGQNPVCCQGVAIGAEWLGAESGSGPGGKQGPFFPLQIGSDLLCLFHYVGRQHWGKTAACKPCLRGFWGQWLATG